MSDNKQVAADKPEGKQDSNHSPPKKMRRHKKRTHSLSWLLLILFVSVLIAGYYGWQFSSAAYQKLQQRLALIETQREELSLLHQQQAQLQNNLTTLLDRNINLEKDWILAEVQYLIRLANHRLLLERDVETATTALVSADTRLAKIGDPLLISVRQQLAKDISALRDVAQPDVTGVSLTLSILANDIKDLPLNIPDPKTIKDRDKSKTSISQVDEAEGYLSKIWRDLMSLVRIRNHSQVKSPLLPPEQRYFLVQNLQLQLQQARYAALHGDAVLYIEQLNACRQWLNEYF